MIATTTYQPRLLERVRRVDRQASRARTATLAAGALLFWLSAISVIALADFFLETAWGLRAVLFGVVTATAITGFALMWLRERRRRSMTRTAAEIEHQFPEFGQRTRTVVQYGQQTSADIQADGIRPELVEALVGETAAMSVSVPIEEVVPRQQLKWCGRLLLLIAVVLGWGCTSWEWRRAMSRTLLSDTPYTEISVLPGDITVQGGAAVGVTATLTGRTDRDVTLRVREADSSGAWSLQPMLADARDDEQPLVAKFGGGLDRIEGPLVYRVEAGGIVSPEYRVRVLDPLTIRSISTEVEFPSYTGLPIREKSDGEISALRGSICRIAVELSRPPVEAEVELQPLPEKSHAVEQFTDVDVSGSVVSFVLPAERNLLWTLRATTSDGVSLAPRPQRLRVTEDHPPRLSFDDPDASLEVHTLAEIPMRARATDDYGLTRCGIVFQISGSEEFTLLEEHFDDFLEAIDAGEAQKAPANTRSVLERLLPLEHFELTSRDAVMYYAFAEDNHPEEPQRTESDRRFIDVRPLLQTYRRIESEDGGGGGDGFRSRLTSLTELIRRERSILNWTIQMSQSGGQSSERNAFSFDRLMRSQADIADLTRLLAEGLLERGVDDVDALYQAEAAMLEAIDSLAAGDLETAVFQERDAQQYLVEARDRVDLAIARNGRGGRSSQALRRLNELIMQKIRQETEEQDDTEEAGQLIVAQLMRWARAEEEIADQLLHDGAAGGTGKQTDDETDQDSSEEADVPETSSAGSASSDDINDSNEPEGTVDSESKSTADDPAAEQSIEAGGASLDAIEERQFEILADARELASVMADLDAATELAKERMTQITDTMADAARAIEDGELPLAGDRALQSARQLRELARQINGLTQGDALERIAYGRNLAVDLTRRQRQLADQLQLPENAQMPSAASIDGRLEPGMTSTDVSERSKTLEDVLVAIAGSMMPDAAEAADRVAVAIESHDLVGVKQRLERLAGEISGGSADGDADVALKTAGELKDSADTTERLAAALDEIYRELMKPVIERLRDLEAEAAGLAEQLEQVDNEGEGASALEELADLLDKLKEADFGGAAREELDELLRNSGDSAWEGESAELKLKAEYQAALAQLLEELQRELQELLLSDTDFDADAPVPTMYESLIDRYLKVLSHGR